MRIEDQTALRDWLITTLEPLCDADPEALARYVVALVTKDKPLDKLRENCIDRLDVFLSQDTTDFVDQLFDVIRNRRYIPEGKKENVQPKVSESTSVASESQESTNNIEETKQSPSESQPIPTTAGSNIPPVKRRYSGRDHRSPTSHKRSAVDSPPAKRSQRTYSHSSASSSSSSSPKRSNLSANKPIPSTDYVDNKPSNPHGDSFPYDQETTSNSNPNQDFFPYNPEAPELDYGSHQLSSMSSYSRAPTFMPTAQRTLVTVVTNADPLPSNNKHRHHDGRTSGQRMHRTKRHVVTTSFPNVDHRDRKRPWQKPNGSNSGLTTLEIRKIPTEFNTISKLNEHFSKFGTVTNVQIAYDGSPDSALIAYGTNQEADTAYKNPEPLFNNRFIKIFWHKAQNGNGNTNSMPVVPQQTPTSSEVRPVKKPIPTPHPAKLHWSKTPKISAETSEPSATRLKKKATLPPTPSIVKKEAAKKAAIEIRRKKTGLLEEQIQQQKILLKKFETSETNEEKEAIRSLMKKVDVTIKTLKDSLQNPPLKSTATAPKLSQQDLLKQRAQILEKQLESLRAKTSADMRRAITNTLETKINHQNQPRETNEEVDANLVNDDVDHLLLDDHDKIDLSNQCNETELLLDS